MLGFSISYFFAVIRTFSIFVVLHLTDASVLEWVCNNNFLVNVINLLTWFLIDLIPISTIFFLHWRNYRNES